MRGFWETFRANPPSDTPHAFAQTVEKDHGRLETRRCYVFDQLECPDAPARWPGLRCFAVLDSERNLAGKIAREQRFYSSSLAPQAEPRMCARTRAAAHNLVVLKHITLNLIRLDPVPRKGGIKARRLIAATSDLYRAQLFGLT